MKMQSDFVEDTVVFDTGFVVVDEIVDEIKKSFIDVSEAGQ